MRPQLLFVAAPLLAGAVLAQSPFLLPGVGPVEIDRAVSGQPTERAVPVPALRPTTSGSFGLVMLPEFGGAHAIGPGVPPPGAPEVGSSQRRTGSDTAPPTTPNTGTSAGPASAGPSGPSSGAAGGTAGRGAGPSGPRTAGRGMALEELEATTWSHWWSWNRGVFELPTPRNVKKVAPGTTAVPVDPRPRAALVELCRSPSVPVRVAAVQALGRVGASVEELQPFLEDSAREVRLTALLAIGSGGTAAHAHALSAWLAASRQGESIVAALAGFALLEDGPARRMLATTAASLLGDERNEVQAAAALAITAHDAEAGLVAARRLTTEASTIGDRAFAAQVFGRDADDADVGRLIELASTRSVDVRRSAAFALGRTRTPAALRALTEALERERDQSTRAFVLLALGDHRGDGAEVVLLRELTNGAKALRNWAALALGMWGRDRQDTAALARAVGSALAAERNRDQKGAYLLALGMLQNEAARDLLVAHLAPGEESATRGAAATALGLLGGKASLAPLTETLANDSCPGARQQAARAMAPLGVDALDTLVGALLTEKDPYVRAGIFWSLGAMEHVRATAALLAAAADETEHVEARAAVALSLGRAFRKHEPRMPELRFQHDNLLPPAIVGWAFGQEL